MADANAANSTNANRLLMLITCLRPHQWAKNLLIVLPLVMAHRLHDREGWISVLLAFISFSLAASAMYVLNDLRDREHDRLHPDKKHRPLARGAVSVNEAMGLFIASAVASALIAIFTLPREFLWYLILYIVVTTAYSLGLKRMLMLDVLTLAALYTLRLLAGGAAANVEISRWLLAFSMFFFLSLAFVKRYSELAMLAHHSEAGVEGKRRGGEGSAGARVGGRAYFVTDLDLIRTLGPTSGYMAVLVFALYLNSAEAMTLYPHAGRLWLICPLLLYWITRLWFITQRGQMHHDPVLFALRDRASYAVVAAIVVVAVAASMGGG
jgi:4-hydroxybenzoate polyprenyltransferase